MHQADPLLPADERIDLANCEREPIHIPGAIQPHGFLFVLRDSGTEILQVSDNTSSLFDLPAAELPGRKLAGLLEDEETARLQAWLHEVSERVGAPQRISLGTGLSRQLFHAIAHSSEAGIVLELEPVSEAEELSRLDSTMLLQRSIGRLQEAHSSVELCEIAAEEIRRMTGFARVKVYQFDADWNGRVVAEDRAEYMQTYMGLHFPASDVPAQARRLYTLNKIRLIADVDYTPSTILPTQNPDTGAPLDMSYSVLRSVSPIHIEYLRNMEVKASMSVSILKGDALWGMVACHHMTPLLVPYPIRTACELLCQVLAMLLVVREDVEEKDYTVQLRSTQAKLLEVMMRAEDFVDGVTRFKPNMLDLVGAQGGAIYQDGQVTPVGWVPEEDQIRGLVSWLEDSGVKDVFATDSLTRDYEGGEAIREMASGLLAVSLSRLKPYYALWFRPEVPQTVYWAGNPTKAVTSKPGNPLQLHPRTSFEAWKDILRGRALPWRPGEIEAARDVRNAINDVVLVRAEKLARLNTSLEAANTSMAEMNDRLRNEVNERTEAEKRLEQSNTELTQRNRELQHFAYVATHDLQEPLRKVQAFADLTLKDYGHAVDETGRYYLERMQEAANRMSRLISGVVTFSRILTDPHPFRQVDLNAVLRDVSYVYKDVLVQKGGTLAVGALPTITADAKQMRMLFENLIDNALKFASAGTPPVIRLEAAPGVTDKPSDGQEAYYRISVQDNGIGFDEKYLDRIFRPFQRLHNKEVYSGTGIGLAICRRIVERHRGRITARSTPGAGTTFEIELPASQPEHADASHQGSAHGGPGRSLS